LTSFAMRRLSVAIDCVLVILQNSILFCSVWPKRCSINFWRLRISRGWRSIEIRIQQSTILSFRRTLGRRINNWIISEGLFARRSILRSAINRI
jgi:hypothetical protein